MINNTELKFKVSVIIPVFRKNHFVQNAINSVLVQDEVGEILLVENDALEICEEIENQNDKVRVITPSIEKIGNFSASLNLGITRSNFDYVAFLDANDWYLPNRFKKDKETFSKYSEANVVYSSVQRGKNGSVDPKNAKIGNIRQKLGEDVSPKEFYKYVLLVKQRHPSFHTSSITIKKEFLLEDKLFDERLQLHWDSELWRRLLRRGNFYSGELLKPVSVVRSIGKNRQSQEYINSRLQMYAVFVQNVGVQNMYEFEKNTILRKFLG
jgi:glycosyltransferase involved in cell wall biosynthesis